MRAIRMTNTRHDHSIDQGWVGDSNKTLPPSWFKVLLRNGHFADHPWVRGAEVWKLTGFGECVGPTIALVQESGVEQSVRVTFRAV